MCATRGGQLLQIMFYDLILTTTFVGTHFANPTNWLGRRFMTSLPKVTFPTPPGRMRRS
jgi:hypothetical protein